VLVNIHFLVDLDVGAHGEAIFVALWVQTTRAKEFMYVLIWQYANEIWEHKSSQIAQILILTD